MVEEGKYKSLEEYRRKVADLDDKDINELEELSLQNKEAAKNTFYRYPKVEPDIIKANPAKGIMQPEVRTINGKILLDKIDEVTLYILCEFKFIPIWLIQEWYQIYYPGTMEGYNRVMRWIDFGLAWCEPTSLGVYIRPTMFLLNVIYDKDEGSKQYIGLPFNLMNHTCSEEQLLFDVMMGNPVPYFWMSFKNDVPTRFPCYHPLHVSGGDPSDKNGTIILSETLFRSNRWKPEELVEGHEQLAREVQLKKPITSEFSDWKLFTLECGYNNKGDLETQRPDLAIPVPRIDGKAQSWALEMELTAKTVKRYEKILDHYKNNNVYGFVVYLCGTNYIMELVRKAFANIGGLGTCRLVTIPYTPPAQMLSSFDKQNLEAQYGLLKATTAKTNEVANNG